MKTFFFLVLAITGGGAMTTAPTVELTKPADQVVYQAGTNSFTGITVVTVKGDGHVKVTFQRGRAKEAFEGNLKTAERKALSAVLQEAFAGAAVQAAYTPVPDEARISVNFTSGTTKRSLTFWQNQANDHKSLKTVMNSFQQMAKTVSGGKVTY